MQGCSFVNYEINITNLKNNIKYLKTKLGERVKFCAVVKANAYGVGVENVVPVLSGMVDAFAVANLSEGIAVRKLDFRTPIIVLGAINFDAINDYSYYFLTPTASTVLDSWKLSRRVKKPLLVEFGLNTGMNRIGFSKKTKILRGLRHIHKNKNLTLWGAFSHLSTKQNNVEFMNVQKEKFEQLLSVFNFPRMCKHISNSSATLHNKNFNYDMVRVGWLMYGMGEEDENLKPVVEIKTRIVQINRIKKNESVGYDRTYIAKKNRKIAVLPIGYFDGVGRGLSNKGQVIVNGEFAPIVGRVCMDMMMIDVTGVKNVRVGTLVTIIGHDGDKRMSLNDHANILNTSVYEVLSRFNNSRMNIIKLFN